jgi:hypothetical protein
MYAGVVNLKHGINRIIKAQLFEFKDSFVLTVGRLHICPRLRRCPYLRLRLSVCYDAKTEWLVDNWSIYDTLETPGTSKVAKKIIDFKVE